MVQKAKTQNSVQIYQIQVLLRLCYGSSNADQKGRRDRE